MNHAKLPGSRSEGAGCEADQHTAVAGNRQAVAAAAGAAGDGEVAACRGADLLRDEGALEAYVCANVGSTFHPVGTCRMGAETDAQSVVDPKGRVIGAQNLYVADASVMPEITRTNTNLPAIMIGEKMADLIAAA